MKRSTGAVVQHRTFVNVVLFLACWILISAVGARAQQGQNAVYNPSGTITNSPAFIDAAMFAANFSSPNFCSVLNYILTPLNKIVPSAGAVIDARGLINSTPPTSMTCTTTNPSPWAGITNPPPSTILLPATGTFASQPSV
jgi:hypothetical protein